MPIGIKERVLVLPFVIIGAVSGLIALAIARNYGGITEAMARSQATLVPKDPHSRQRVVRLYRALGAVWAGFAGLVVLCGAVAMVVF